MQINSEDFICGQTIISIRDFLKYVQLRDWWTIDFLTARLRVSKSMAKKIINVLVEQGYIEESKRYNREKAWVNTIKGNSLAMASAAKPIYRRTADDILLKFMKRVNEVNTNDKFAFRVEKVIVFGSYLSDKERLNDIDLAIKLESKEKDKKKRRQREQERISIALKSGRVFGNFLQEVFWPMTEVKLFLKNRSRSISLHDTDDPILQETNYKVLYEYK
ncbi:MAG: nucleotidyltransferase domain-containing protein [Bacillota bacterium]